MAGKKKRKRNASRDMRTLLLNNTNLGVMPKPLTTVITHACRSLPRTIPISAEACNINLTVYGDIYCLLRLANASHMVRSDKGHAIQSHIFCSLDTIFVIEKSIPVRRSLYLAIDACVDSSINYYHKPYSHT